MLKHKLDQHKPQNIFGQFLNLLKMRTT